MTQISQTLGIDASQALQQLALLDQGFTKLAATLQAMPGVFNLFTSSANASQAAATNVASSLKSMSPAAASATAGVTRLTTSVQLLSRIVFTQAVIRGLRLIEQGAAKATAEFTNFEKALSEIRAISPSETLDGLATSSKELSNALNLPLLEVAKSRYDLISNGFTTAAAQQDVFTAAAKLGKLGVANQKEAIDLLSTSLNAYGEKSNQAARFARGFFQAANVGKFTIAELAANFGKAAPAAKSLGVSLEETLALFSSLTNKGVSTPEAATQINSLFASFIKPSKGMTAALNELGVASGQELIRLRGFAGALNTVVGSTDGTAASLAKLFPNVRALRGLLTESNDGFTTLADHFKSLIEFSGKDFDNRLLDRLSTDSEHATAALNKLKNAVTIGLGGGLIETAATLDRMTNKVDLLSTATEKFFRVITGHGLQDAGAALSNFASRDIDAVHDQLFRALQEKDQLRQQVLDNARTQPANQPLPLGAKNLENLDSILDSALNLEKAQAFDTEVQKIIEHLQAASPARNRNPALNAQFNEQLGELVKLSQQAKVTDDDLRKVMTGFQSVESQVSGLDNLGFNTSLKLAARSMEDIIERRALLQQIPFENLNQVQNAFEGLKTSTVNSAAAAANLADAYERAAAAAERAAAASSRSEPTSKAFGGSMVRAYSEGGPVLPMHYFNRGGAAKGTDTISAMLSPGEFVINSASAAKFFPQLQAINAGHEPVFRESGGSVTNAGIVGDVSINVTNNGAPISGREIADAINRQIRRGSARLR